MLYFVKSKLYSVLPGFIKSYLIRRKQIHEFHQTLNESIEMDKQRLLHYGFSYNRETYALLCNLRMLTHFIEKGLTMPDTRPCFGLMRLQKIADLVEEIGSHEASAFEMQYIAKVIQEYVYYHQTRNQVLPDTHLSTIRRIQNVLGTPFLDIEVAQRHYTMSSYFTVDDGAFSAIAESRHSARNYINKEIANSVFVDVARVASTAPSACNRQPCKMHVIKDRILMQKVLSLGVGCGGFGHLASAIIIVSSDLCCRDNIVERHQVGVDAGFFGMNLLYALHEKKIGACVLNWDNLKSKDVNLRKIVPTLKDSETVLFIVSCGYTPDEFDIPLGLKVPVENIIDFIE